MTNLINLLETKKTVLLLFAVSTVFLFSTAIPKDRLLKRDKEIEHIREKDYRFDACVQYGIGSIKRRLVPLL